MRRHDGGFTGKGRSGASALTLAAALAAASCGAKQEAAPTAPSKDYKSEAKSAIDEKNMDAEMKKLKSEIEADSK